MSPFIIRKGKTSSLEWEDGFTMKPGCSRIEEAESWALLHGIRLAWKIGTRRLLVQIDKRAGIDCKSPCQCDTRMRWEKNWVISLNHILMEGNHA